MSFITDMEASLKFGGGMRTDPPSGTLNQDWDRLRKEAFAPAATPTDWPSGVRPISQSGLNLFGLDEKRQLYWDGHAVITKRRLYLAGWEWWFALFATIGAIVQAVVAVIGLFHK